MGLPLLVYGKQTLPDSLDGAGVPCVEVVCQEEDPFLKLLDFVTVALVLEALVLQLPGHGIIQDAELYIE